MMFSFLRRPRFSLHREVWISDDQQNMDTFVMSRICVSMEKSLHNRMAKLSDSIIGNCGTEQSIIAKGKMDEIADILLEWGNLRADLLKKK